MFLKKAAIQRTLLFRLCIDKCEIKNQWSAGGSIGVGTFTSTSTFEPLSLQYVRMNELKKFMLEGL